MAAICCYEQGRVAQRLSIPSGTRRFRCKQEGQCIVKHLLRSLSIHSRTNGADWRLLVSEADVARMSAFPQELHFRMQKASHGAESQSSGSETTSNHFCEKIDEAGRKKIQERMTELRKTRKRPANKAESCCHTGMTHVPGIGRNQTHRSRTAKCELASLRGTR